MALKFADLPNETYVNVLIYAGPKTGKTTAACSAPGPVALLNADLPNASLFARRSYPGVQEIQYEGLQTLADLTNAVQAAADKPGLLNTVVVDPVGELHRRLLEEQSNRAVRPDIRVYGDVSVYIERFCRRLCELPVNTVIVCHETTVKDEVTGEMIRTPFTGTQNPTLGQKLMGMVDIVAYCGVKVDESGDAHYLAQLLPGAGRIGGDRFAVLGSSREANLTEWFEAIAQSFTVTRLGSSEQPRSIELPTEAQVDAEEALIEQEIAADVAAEQATTTPRRRTRKAA